MIDFALQIYYSITSDIQPTLHFLVLRNFKKHIKVAGFILKDWTEELKELPTHQKFIFFPKNPFTYIFKEIEFLS